MSHKIFKDLIKEEIKLTDLNKVSQQDVVENALGKLALLDDEKFNKQIVEYREKKEKIYTKINEVNQEFVNLVDGYYKALLEGL